MMEYRDKLKKQLEEAGANVVFTYSAHWTIVNNLKSHYDYIKILQIVLMALSTTGFVTSLITIYSYLGWIGSLMSAVALGLHLHILIFNYTDKIKQHTDAANELWYVRESYKSLLTDFEVISDNDIREKRDQLIKMVSQINKEYPGTDEESFKEAQKTIGKYIFDDDEAEKLMNVK